MHYLNFQIINACCIITKLKFTCLNSTIETIEKGVKYVQS